MLQDLYLYKPIVLGNKLLKTIENCQSLIVIHKQGDGNIFIQVYERVRENIKKKILKNIEKF